MTCPAAARARCAIRSAYTASSSTASKVFDGKDYTHAKGPGVLLDRFLPAGPVAMRHAAK
jgi:hypothetical protein